MSDLAGQRRFYAEEIQVIAGLKTPALVEALATVPRERFLPPGPWTFRSEADFVASAPRQTVDDDPRHVCHNVTVAIDAGRNLYNGNPSFVGMAIDALALTPGARALHVGAGMGYYSALIGSCVGPSGRVLALEADEPLAVRAKANLASMPWIEARHGDAMSPFGESFDGILVNAGATHPPDVWLDALAPGGRMILPLTSSVASMGLMNPMANIGKGLLVLLTRTDDPDSLAARVVTFVAIFNAVGARDEALNAELWKALQKTPFPPLKRLRRDSHDRADTCWLHGPAFCLATA
jgi:protein-L-isoaspartate(D-aspartate) O-methyltransferase